MAKKKKQNKINCLFTTIDSLAAVVIIATVVFFILIAFSYLLHFDSQRYQRPLDLNYLGVSLGTPDFSKVKSFNDNVALYEDFLLDFDENKEFYYKIYFTEDESAFDLGDGILMQVDTINEKPINAIVLKENEYYFNTVEYQAAAIVNRLYYYNENTRDLRLELIDIKKEKGEIYDWQEEWGLLARDDKFLYLSYVKGDYALGACHNYWNNNKELQELYGAQFYTGVKILDLKNIKSGFINKALGEKEVNYGKEKTEACLNNLLLIK